MTGYVQRQAVYELVVDGKAINDDVVPRLMSLNLTERRGAEADVLELVLDDRDGKLAIPPANAIITLKLGWRDLKQGGTAQLIDKGSFKVDERCHDGVPDKLTIRAKSADLTKAFRTRRTQTWSNTTLGAVLGDIAARNSLQPAVAADKAAVAVSHLTQGRESDSAFLARLGRLHDAVATIKNGRLLFAAVGSGVTAGTGQEIPVVTITRSSGDKHRWKAAEREKFSGVIAEWHDRGSAVRHQVVVGSAENAKKLGRVYASEAAARRAAGSQRSKQDRKGAEFGLDLARGAPELFPERKVTVSGFKAEIDGTAWLIAEARHTLDGGGGLRTVLQMEVTTAPARAS